MIPYVLDETGRQVYVETAQRNQRYICPSCKEAVVLCDGEIMGRYFRHIRAKKLCLGPASDFFMRE